MEMTEKLGNLTLNSKLFNSQGLYLNKLFLVYCQINSKLIMYKLDILLIKSYLNTFLLSGRGQRK